MVEGYRRHAMAVYERDGWVCHLCDLPVARNREAPHPLSPSLDHVIPRVRGGSHDPENLKTAHLVCNSSKSDRDKRSAGTCPITLDALYESMPDVRAKLEAFREALEHKDRASTDTPLPEVNKHSIGDAFDEAMALGEASLLAAGPDGTSLGDWVETEAPMSEHEAVSLVCDRVEELHEDEEWLSWLSSQLRESEPRCWIVPRVLNRGPGPDSMQDTWGWEEVAEAVMEYCERGLVKRVAAEVMTALSRAGASPMERVAGLLSADSARRADEPGFWAGHHHASYSETVKELKRSGRLEEARDVLFHLVEATEAEDHVSQLGVSPGHYEHLAIVQRKLGDSDGERATLERFARQRHAPGELPAKLMARLEGLPDKRCS